MSTAKTKTSKATTKARTTAKPARDFSPIAGMLADIQNDMPAPAAKPEADAAERLNRAMSLAFAAWSIAEAGGRASVSFGFGGDPILDINAADVLGLEGDGQRLAATDTVAI